jgi:uncharacterized protein YigA (DUF484 family)
MAKEEPQTEVSWEEAVGRYLEDNPDFFAQRPQLLAQLQLTHPEKGTAVSLIERQVEVLRDQNQFLQRQLRELISNARENDVIGHRLHDFACTLLQAGDLNQVLEATESRIRDKFRLDAATLRLAASADVAGDRPELVAPEDEVLQELLQWVQAGTPAFAADLSESLQSQLFGAVAETIRSIVVVPLGDPGLRGAMVLGSQDPHRFEAGMATDYLVRLGELVQVAVGRYI